jgi:hypothetical protein
MANVGAGAEDSGWTNSPEKQVDAIGNSQAFRIACVKVTLHALRFDQILPVRPHHEQDERLCSICNGIDSYRNARLLRNRGGE